MEETKTEQQNLNQAPQSKNIWKEYIELILLVLVIVIPFRLFIAQPFIVDGASMSPTFETGQYLIVDELSYHFKTPDRGTVIIFKYPKNPKKYFIKRIIGLPGETVEIKEGIVNIVNNENPEGFTLTEPYVQFEKQDNTSYKLGPKEYFVLGDNRAGSADSRVWGPVPEANIIGSPFVRLHPFSFNPGDESKFNINSSNIEKNE